VIEYALLFALGFLAATLTGLLVAPAIQKRIVKFTEARMRATMPLSPQEVRAQKDMARAAYAAENARLSESVRREREKHTLEMVRNEKLLAQAAAIGTENAELHAQIADMNIEAGDMRSALRREEMKTEQLKTALLTADREIRGKITEIEALHTRINHLEADLDTMKIDLATRDTTMENLKSRIGNLTDEREKLRDDIKTASQAAKALEMRLSREEGRVRQLETRLTRELAGSADKDNAIERRIAEINRLRDKVKTLTAENKEAVKAARSTGLARTIATSRISARRAEKVAPPPIDIGALEEDVRNQGTALSERLMAAKTGENDAALREEMADLASKMIVLTAAREGAGSPVHDLIATIDPALEGEDRSLAQRVRERIGRDEA
jgi:predicted  nucleic acid-binding Zn-ribbon protein